MKKKYIKTIKLSAPNIMEYSIMPRSAKELEKFVKRCEKIIRSSQEYKDYISFLRENIDMDRCAFFNNVTNESNRRIKIEIHHEPFTLYDIVFTVVNKFIAEGIPLNDLMIAEEVMDLHYNNMVGLIPLSLTIHQVVHKSNKIVIPINLCYGDFRKFLDEYEEYIPEGLYDKLESKIAATKILNSQSFDAIQTQFEYIEVDGVQLPQKVEIEGTAIA